MRFQLGQLVVKLRSVVVEVQNFPTAACRNPIGVSLGRHLMFGPLEYAVIAVVQSVLHIVFDETENQTLARVAQLCYYFLNRKIFLPYCTVTVYTY